MTVLERRSLNEMPFDMRFWISENQTELCHATGYEVLLDLGVGEPEWWNEYKSMDGELLYGR